MKALLALVFCVAGLGLGGCAGTSPARLVTTGLTTAGGAIGGAAIGTAVSGGNPIGTAIGAGVGGTSGYAIGEGIGMYHDAEDKKKMQEGYFLGRGDASKEFYWNLQAMQKQSASTAYGINKNYEIDIPGGETEDGINLVPDTINFPVTE